MGNHAFARSALGWSAVRTAEQAYVKVVASSGSVPNRSPVPRATSLRFSAESEPGFFEPSEVFPIERLRRAEVHRDSVLDYPVLIEYPIKRLERAPAPYHVVLRDDFEPIDNRLFREDVVVVGHP
jgi:hypothetical protein